MIHGKFIEVEPAIIRFHPRGINIFYFLSGRGLGKTYSALDICRKMGDGTGSEDFKKIFQPGDKFLYMRRTKVEAETVSSEEGNAFKRYNMDEKTEICSDWIGKLGFGNWYLDREHQKHIGYTAGLSTFSNLRGVDFSDVRFILFDECIPEKLGRARIEREGILLLNAMETINRNRAILGEPEIILLMLSNAIDLGSTLLSELGLTPILNNMIFKNQTRYTDYERSLHIEKYADHKVSEEKKESMLYKFAKGTSFYEESLTGDFVNNNLSIVSKVNLQEYYCWIRIENLYVYKHKSEERLHISTAPSTAKIEFRVAQKLKFKDLFYWRYKLYVLENKVTYDNYHTKVVFDSMINYKEPY